LKKSIFSDIIKALRVQEVRAVNREYYIMNREAVSEKVREAAASILPIVALVVLLSLSVLPMPAGLMLSFLVGALLTITGIGLFSLGAELAMTPIGSKIGTSLTRTRKLPLILLVSFILGFAVTIAEPDLQVLASTVPHIDKTVLLVTVGVGVGFFLAMCMLRIIFGIKLRWILLVSYAVVFTLSTFSPAGFLSVAFDSGGVTTGPMTVPFILALGVGIANTRSDRNAEADSFGLVALCSIGPVLAVLLLGLFHNEGSESAAMNYSSYATTSEIGLAYVKELPLYIKEMAVALLPIVVIFFIFQLATLRISGRPLARICIGILYTYVGLVLFLTGVNVGFSPLGTELGSELASGSGKYLLIPLSMIFGWFIISAEPAVLVLQKQVEDISAGAIPGKAIKLSLSVAIALAMGLSMLRVLTGISLMWILVPGYAIALVLSFFVPDIYTAIAFDSGGVASGPMTATFMLQLMIGTSSALGGNVLTDAFGIVATVAMMPLISIQVVGFIYNRKAAADNVSELYADDEIVELWEVSAS